MLGRLGLHGQDGPPLACLPLEELDQRRVALDGERVAPILEQREEASHLDSIAHALLGDREDRGHGVHRLRWSNPFGPFHPCCTSGSPCRSSYPRQPAAYSPRHNCNVDWTNRAWPSFALTPNAQSARIRSASRSP